jgi:UDP-glucose 4-epimerase
MKDMHGVFHLAALWLLQCHEYPRAAIDDNVRGTFNVLEACVANKVQRLVWSSSASVYGDAVEEPMTEEHPFNNENFYGATKIAGEAMSRAYFPWQNLLRVAGRCKIRSSPEALGSRSCRQSLHRPWPLH